MRRGLVPLIGLLITATACASDGDTTATNATLPAASAPPATTAAAPGTTTSDTPSAPEVTTADARPTLGEDVPLPPPPAVPSGPIDDAVKAAVDALFASLATAVDVEALFEVGASGDARLAWLLSDVLRFFQSGLVHDAAVAAFEELTGTRLGTGFSWLLVTNALMAWDLPAPPGYVAWKRIPFEIIEPAWEPFFADENADIDYRLLSWGGVLIDDRSIDDAAAGLPCDSRCIPALNDPEVTDAEGGSWLDDSLLVFGVVVDGEARAYPKHMMEVHEMVNDTLGERRIGLPYCTLCGSAQAYYTDVVPDGFDMIELRTSGLLSRSNKVMYDLNTFSVFDTFLGDAVSGPLHDVGYRLEMVTVVTSTWGEWKQDHPDTTIVARDGGIGRAYSLDPLRGRDDAGPIFPIGNVDPRLPVQWQVLGVVAPDGTAVAFPVEDVRAEIAAGGEVTLAGIRLVADGGGFRAELTDGTPLASHQSFWFAWSQFRPETLIWSRSR